MSLQDDIAAQEQRKKGIKNIGIGAIKSEPKMRRSTRDRVKAAEYQQKMRVIRALRDGKRNIPKEWERGYHAAMSAVERALDSK